MKAVELRKKPGEELLALERELRLRGEELAVALRQNKVKNVRELRQVHKDIARIKTILHQQKS